jgi:hypothetical protein
MDGAPIKFCRAQCGWVNTPLARQPLIVRVREPALRSPAVDSAGARFLGILPGADAECWPSFHSYAAA